MNKNTPQESVQNTKNMDLLGNYIVKSQEDISNILCKKMPALENIHKTYSFVFMELVQNILKHGLIDQTHIAKINIEKKNNLLQLSISNYFDPKNKNDHTIFEELDRFSEFLEKLNQYNSEELEKVYLQKLKDSASNNNNISGLGLLDVARKATKIVENNNIAKNNLFGYNIEKQGKYYYITLSINLSIPENISLT